MKKVLLTITSLSGGGAERVVSVWSKELKEQGYDVSILVCERFDGEYKIEDGIKVYSIASIGEGFGDYSFIKRYKIFRKTIKQISPDVVINFLPKMQIWMMFATMFRRIRKIETIRISPWHLGRTGLVKILINRYFKRADAVILQTAEQGEYYSKKVQKKCHVVYNPVAEQYKQNPKTEYRQAIQFVGAGRLTTQKNFELMISAFKIASEKCPNIKLAIYGEGSKDYVDKLNALIQENGLTDTVKLMGRSLEMPTVLKNADAFIMSSDYEGLPNALIEAMCVGLPCVSTNCRTGPKDLIDDGENGFLVPVGDTKAMAEAIIKIAELEPDKAQEIGEKAREKILDICGKEKSLNQLIKVIEG